MRAMMPALAALILLCVSCVEDDCVYCGVDISGGVKYGTDAPVIVKDQDTAQPDIGSTDTDIVSDEEESDDGTTPDEDAVLPVENMVLIAETTFMMGCEDGVAPYCTETNATPRHEVTVLGFELDVYEVTKKDFEACIAAQACKNETEEPTQYNIHDGEHPFCILHGSYGDTYPANCVSWHGARAYCEWLGKRLPTEAEWELAARGTDDRWYPWGNTPGPSCSNTVMEGNSDWGCDGGLSLPVGSMEAGKSPHDIYDMAGNVWEWVEDDWHDDYDSADRPDDGSAWIDATRPANRVMRGGSFMIGSDEPYEFTAYGHYGAPADDAGVSRGFRCAR